MMGMIRAVRRIENFFEEALGDKVSSRAFYIFQKFNYFSFPEFQFLLLFH